MAERMFGLSLIPAPSDSGTTRETERAIKAAYTAMLATPEGLDALRPYKLNGSPTGHKVGDNIDAVRALARLAEKLPQHGIVGTTTITDYRKTQLLDAALRPWQEIGKDGKLIGKPGPKMLKLMHIEDQPTP